MASSSEWYQFAPDGVLKILRPLWLNFGCSRLARLMSLRAAATERDVRHGMEFPQGRGLHTSLTSGFISDVGIVVEELSRDLHAGWMGEDRPSR